LWALKELVQGSAKELAPELQEQEREQEREQEQQQEQGSAMDLERALKKMTVGEWEVWLEARNARE
jgi:hypothetical protein